MATSLNYFTVCVQLSIDSHFDRLLKFSNFQGLREGKVPKIKSAIVQISLSMDTFGGMELLKEYMDGANDQFSQVDFFLKVKSLQERDLDPSLLKYITQLDLG